MQFAIKDVLVALAWISLYFGAVRSLRKAEGSSFDSGELAPALVAVVIFVLALSLMAGGLFFFYRKHGDVLLSRIWLIAGILGVGFLLFYD